MKYVKDFRNLCTPAFVYLVINVIIFISIAVQNFGNSTQYCVGQYKCQVPNTLMMFVFKAVYILFWTFVLNSICKAGHKEVSWFLVLLPIILLFVILGLVLLKSSSLLLEGLDYNHKFHSQDCIKRNKSEWQIQKCISNHSNH